MMLLPSYCDVIDCARFLCPSDCIRIDLCIFHAKKMCMKAQCFNFKSTQMPMFCKQHQRVCIHCKKSESEICLNLNGICADCYSEYMLQQELIKYKCSFCQCQLPIVDSKIFQLSCFQCKRKTLFCPIMSMDVFQTLFDDKIFLQTIDISCTRHNYFL